jgi:hypothetical protein
MKYYNDKDNYFVVLKEDNNGILHSCKIFDHFSAAEQYVKKQYQFINSATKEGEVAKRNTWRLRIEACLRHKDEEYLNE